MTRSNSGKIGIGKRTFPVLAVAMIGAAAVPSASAAYYGGGDLARYLPGGIVFPGYNQSILTNPAALPDGAVTDVEIADRPSLLDRTDNAASVSIATSNSSAGIGAGYARNDYSGGGGSANAVFAGAGFGLGPVRLGMDYVAGLGSTGGNSLGAGILLGAVDGGGLRFAGTVNDINFAPRLSAGLGYSQAGTFNLEADLNFPSFQCGLFSNGCGYSLFGNASVYAGSGFGIGFDVTYFQAWGSGYDGSWLYGVSAMFRPASWPAITLRYTSFRDITASVAFTL